MYPWEQKREYYVIHYKDGKTELSKVRRAEETVAFVWGPWKKDDAQRFANSIETRRRW